MFNVQVLADNNVQAAVVKVVAEVVKVSASQVVSLTVKEHVVSVVQVVHILVLGHVKVFVAMLVGAVATALHAYSNG